MPGNEPSNEPSNEPGNELANVSPALFAKDVLDVRLWWKQKEVLEALAVNRRVAVKSGNGLGKGFCASVAVLWFLHSHDPAIVLSTAPTFRQVRHVLWRQIRRLHRPVADVLGGKMLDTRWELADDRYAMGLSAESADQFQGFHSDNMLIVVDEAEGVSDEIYEGIEAVMTSSEPRLLLIGNPTTVSGAFRRAFYEERNLYHPITISALESPNVDVRKDQNQKPWPGLTTAEWVKEREETWGKDNPIYRARVLGEFPDQGEDTLFNLTQIEQTTQRVLSDSTGPGSYAGADANAGSSNPANAEVVLAVDVARFGSDRSVILRRRGNRVEEIRTFQKLDTMALTGWVIAAIKEFSPSRVVVDEIGVGAGVVDRLKEEGHPVRGVNVARRAREDNTFANLRSEGFWRLRDLFATGGISIPADNQLIGELAALRYSYDSRGRILMESKEAMRRRGLPSPDKADALMLAFLEPVDRVKLWT